MKELAVQAGPEASEQANGVKEAKPQTPKIPAGGALVLLP